MSVSAGEIEKAESRAKAKAPRQYTEEYRLEAVEYYRKAREADPKKSIRECASELGINDKTLNDWVLGHQVREDGKGHPGQDRRAEGARRGEETHQGARERERVPKKSSSLLRQEPLTEDRFRLMLEEKADYSVSMMARVLGVSRSGFYRWLKAGGSGEDPWGPLKEAIIEIWDASGRRFGFRKVWSRPSTACGNACPSWGYAASAPTPPGGRRCRTGTRLSGLTS